MKRRTFLKAAVGAAAAGLAAAAGYGALVEPGQIDVVEQRVALQRLGPGLDGLRVAQISDLHMSAWFTEERLAAVTGQVLDLQPDLVWMTGDYIVHRQDAQAALRALSGPLGTLAQSVPVYAVLGNHDFYDGNNVLVHDTLVSLGVTDVTNTHETFQRSGDTLYIAGVGTLSTGHMELDQVSYNAPRDSAVVLLAHEPDVVQWAAQKPKLVMQVSGHSHGGQVDLPPVGPLILPWMGQMYPRGRYDINGFPLYVNRGLGTTRVPLRVNCPPEITLFTLTVAG